MLFSATFPRQVEVLARKVLNKPVEIQVCGHSVVNKDITQSIEVRPEGERFLKLLELLGEWYEKGKILVFVQSQEKCDVLFKELLKHGYPCLSLHGAKDQTDRESTISDFKSNICNLLIATSVATMESLSHALDIKDTDPIESISTLCQIIGNPSSSSKAIQPSNLSAMGAYLMDAELQDEQYHNNEENVVNEKLSSMTLQQEQAVVVIGNEKILDLSWLEEDVNKNLPLVVFGEKQVFMLQFVSDNICKVAFGVDPDCLHPSLPRSLFAEAFNNALHISVGRFFSIFPFLSRIKRKLDIGSKRRLREAINIVNKFAMDIIRCRRSEISEGHVREDLLSRFMAETLYDWGQFEIECDQKGSQKMAMVSEK